MSSTVEASVVLGSPSGKALSSPKRDLFQRGFLNTRSRPPLLVNNSETGSSSESGAAAGADRYPDVVIRSKAAAPALGITFGGMRRGLWIF
ncbi:hypothetical protein SLA2020_264450 [Shorea laevis]